MHLKFLPPLLTAFLPLCAEEAVSELTSLFEESSSLVAQSRLNVDYTPSVVSVLHHDDLTRLGITNLFDALGLLPGIETSITQNNHKKVTVRRQNLPNSHSYQKVKLVIDGVSIETAMYGNSDYYMNFPVRLIRRIEVLRGPGSSLYGTGAFNGVISVTTFLGDSESDNRAFGAIGSDDYRLGGMFSHLSFQDGSQFWLDGYYQSDNERLSVDPSFTHDYGFETLLDPVTFIPIDFPRSYEAVGDTDDFSVGMKLKKENLSFDARYKENQEGNLYGWDEFLELTDTNRRTERYLYTRLKYDAELGPTTELSSEVGYTQYRFRNDAQMFEEPLQHFFVPSDAIIGESESSWYASTHLHESRFEGHQITAGAEFRSTRLRSSRFEYRIGGTLYLGPELFPEGLERETSTLYANDTFRLAPSLDALASLRYDYYSDHTKGYPSLQLGTIYTQPNWRVKFNYGHAYKVPNWVELYARIYNPDGRNPLVAETSDGIDLIWIYEPAPQHRFKLDGYYARMHEVIDINEVDATSTQYSYANLGSRNSYGVEAEYDYKPSPSHRFHANLSWSRSTYISPDEGNRESQVPDTADLMIKGYYLYYPTANFSLGTTVRYIGPRERQEYRRLWSYKPLGSYTLVDVAATYTLEQWQLSATVKNLLDDNVRYGSFYSFHDGIPGSGRQWLFQMERRF